MIECKKFKKWSFLAFAVLISVLLLASCDPEGDVIDETEQSTYVTISYASTSYESDQYVQLTEYHTETYIPDDVDLNEVTIQSASMSIPGESEKKELVYICGGETASAGDDEGEHTGTTVVVEDNNVTWVAIVEVEKKSNVVATVDYVQRVELNATSVTLSPSAEVDITATVFPETSSLDIDWSLSGDVDTVVLVDNKDGTCTIKNNGNSKGSCVVTATAASGKSASCEIELIASNAGILEISTDTFLDAVDVWIPGAVQIPIYGTVRLVSQVERDDSEIANYTWEMSGEDSDCIYLFPAGDSCLLYARYRITEEAQVRLKLELKDKTCVTSQWCDITTNV